MAHAEAMYEDIILSEVVKLACDSVFFFLGCFSYLSLNSRPPVTTPFLPNIGKIAKL